MKLDVLTWIALILTVVGGLNWGLVGIFDFDLVKWLFTDTLKVQALARIVYVIVALAAIYLIGTAAGIIPQGKSEQATKS